MVDTRTTFQPWLILSIVVFIAVLLRLPNLTESIWFDELWSTYYKLGSFRQLAYYGVYDVSPPFHYVFMFGWIRIFGDSELSIRIPALVFGVLSIPLAYAIAAKYFDRQTGLLVALMLSLSPVHIWYSQEARPYSMLIFALLISMLAVEKLRESKSNLLWLSVYIIAAGASLFSHYFLVFPIVLLTALLFATHHPESRRLLIANVLVCTAFTVYLAMKFAMGGFRTSVAYGRAFTLDEAYQLFFNWFALGNAVDPEKLGWLVIFIQLIFALLAIRGLYRLFSDRDATPRAYEVALYCFVLPAALWFLSFFASGNYIERSALVAMPFFFMIIAAGITATRSATLKTCLTTALILTNVAALTSYFWRSDEWTVYKQNVDWRGASTFLHDRSSEASGRTIVLAFSPADELSYYDPSVQQVSCAEVGKEAAAVSSQPSERERLVVVRMGADPCTGFEDFLMQSGSTDLIAIRNGFWLGSFEDAMPAITGDPRFRVETLTEFKGLTIYAIRFRKTT
jgi:mannosyltransferase